MLGMSLGEKGDLARAKAELDTALRMAPGSAEILTFYAGWASTFGEPERGVELVDQVIRLDPNYPLWTTNIFSYAYFMAGRYEDALKMQARMAPDTYNPMKWSMRCEPLSCRFACGIRLGNPVPRHALCGRAAPWSGLSTVVDGVVTEKHSRQPIHQNPLATMERSHTVSKRLYLPQRAMNWVRSAGVVLERPRHIIKTMFAGGWRWSRLECGRTSQGCRW